MRREWRSILTAVICFLLVIVLNFLYLLLLRF